VYGHYRVMHVKLYEEIARHGLSCLSVLRLDSAGRAGGAQIPYFAHKATKVGSGQYSASQVIFA
jgi:hypothetical protein